MFHKFINLQIGELLNVTKSYVEQIFLFYKRELTNLRISRNSFMGMFHTTNNKKFDDP